MGCHIELLRWFNRTFPWHQPKRSISKRVVNLARLKQGRGVYEKIQGCLKMSLDLSVDYERSVYLNLNNMVLIRILKKLVRPGDVVVDAGANIGLFSLMAAALAGPGGKVYAFEPQPLAFERFSENIQLNRLNNIVALQKGCWDGAGSATLYDFEGQSHPSPLSSMRIRPDMEARGEVSMETVRVDDVVEGRARLIKVDTEGADWPTLKGAEKLLFRDPRPHLILEVCRANCEGFGYHPMEMADWYLGRSGPCRMHLIDTRRRYRIDREGLAGLVEKNPRRPFNVWFEG